MIFKLWHKIALTIIGITSVILILALVLSQQSVKTGFLAYLNDIEESRIKDLSNRLINQYEFYGDWEFMNRRLWHRYVRESKPSRPGGKRPGRPPPPLHELGRRSGGQGLPPPRPPPPREREKRDWERKNPENKQGGQKRSGRESRDRHSPPDHPPKHQRPEHQRPPPPEGRRPPPPPPQAISLLDSQHERVAGFRSHTKDAINKPLTLDGETIGYLRVEPFTEFVDELEQKFIDHQQQAFMKIAVIALLLTMLGAWVLALYLRRRINLIGHQARVLMEGKYTAKIKHSSSDELGQLADHLNHLGKTLHENRQSRQRWIADISHELRTPLAILQGQVEALEDGIRPFDDKAIKLFGGEVSRLGKLVEDLYQLSLSDLGALSYSKETLNFGHLIEGIADQFQQRLTAKELNLHLSFTTCLQVSILGDPQRLRQLFINILENSIRYTNSGGCIKITCRRLDRQVVLSIEDSAPSVPSDQLDQLFQRLYRGESSRNRNTGGAGLGLSIVKSIVEAHEGTIEAKASSLGGLLLELQFPIIHSRT